MAANPVGGGTAADLTNASPYAAGTVVSIQAVAAAGYQFVNWSATTSTFGSVTAATTNFTMPSQNVTVTANFVAVYNLTMAVTPGGSGTATDLTNASPYAAGTVVNIQAVAAAGCQFANWTAPAGTLGNATAAVTNFTMPAQNVTVTANFAVIPPGQYSLTISSTTGGSVTTPGEGTFIRSASTVVSLVASADTGYRFVSWIGDVGTVSNVRTPSSTITMNGNYHITANFEAKFMIAAGEMHTVGLKSDGTVVAVGDNSYGQRNVGGWADIIQVAAGNCHTVGLKSNGTVVAVGDNSYGQCNVGAWTNTVQVAAGLYHTVGLKAGGTAVAVGAVGAEGWPSYGQCDVAGWTNIVQVAAGHYHTVGLKSDGTVIAAGYNYRGQCNIGGWTNIIQVAAGAFHMVGLKAGGTVVAVGDNYDGQCDVSGWTNIIHVSAGDYHTVGLKSEGSVVAVGANWWGQCYVDGWDLN
jgi:hypothetical protein